MRSCLSGAAALPDRSVDTDVLSAGFAGLLSAGQLRRYAARATHASVLWISMFLFVSTAARSQVQDWLRYVRGLGFEARLSEIRKVSELPEAVQRDRVSALIHLLKDEDQSVRITAAAEIAEIRDVASLALPRLIESFEQPHGEEGLQYAAAAAAFGEQALPLLQEALVSPNWLVRARACDTIRIIGPKLYKDGECKEKAR